MQRFLAQIADRVSAPEIFGSGEALPVLLDEIIDRARAAWPTVHLASEHFIDYLAARVSLEESAEVALGRLCTSDLYLACACSRGDVHAVAAFETQCLAVIDGALRPLRCGADLIAEVKQRLCETMLVADTKPPRIALYAGRGRLRDWIRVAAVRECLSEVRRARRSQTVEDGQLDRFAPEMANPELEYMKTLYRREFQHALRSAIHALVPRDRNLLRQHFAQGLNIDELGERNGVHRATAARWLERAKRALLVNTRRALSMRLRIQPGELDSILGLIRSRVDISLRTVFGRRGRAPISQH